MPKKRRERIFYWAGQPIKFKVYWSPKGIKICLLFFFFLKGFVPLPDRTESEQTGQNIKGLFGILSQTHIFTF